MFTPARPRRLSKPSPPQREAEQIKKPNMAQTSPLQFSQGFHTPIPETSSLDPRLQATTSTPYAGPSPSQQTSQPTSFALQQSDMSTILSQLKVFMHEEIQSTFKNFFKSELESALKGTIQGLNNQIDGLRQENAQLRDEIDSLEQYSRRELVRFSGIPETAGEDTTAIVRNIVQEIDSDWVDTDIIRSHRVGKPRTDRQGRKPFPRQIIVRLKDTAVKRRILKCSKTLKDTQHSNVMINEDLTKRRNALAYKARKLKSGGFITNTWTIDGKIFLKDATGNIVTTNTEFALQSYIVKNCPAAMQTLYPTIPTTPVMPNPFETNVISDVITTAQSYAAVAAMDNRVI